MVVYLVLDNYEGCNNAVFSTSEKAEEYVLKKYEKFCKKNMMSKAYMEEERPEIERMVKVDGMIDDFMIINPMQVDYEPTDDKW